MLELNVYFRTQFEESFDHILSRNKNKVIGVIYGEVEPLSSVVGRIVDLNAKLKSGEDAVKICVRGKELLVKKNSIQLVVVFSREDTGLHEKLHLIRKEIIKLFKNIIRILQ